jgi:hypothetical protein
MSEQSVLPNILEKLIVPSLTYIFKNILDNNQLGFRKRRSV